MQMIMILAWVEQTPLLSCNDNMYRQQYLLLIINNNTSFCKQEIKTIKTCSNMHV